ncbi:aspartate aminotransferase [Perkinsela sp. CCAP 1560/4]|nr:aspartate aminotransferase [Perkinsela sp. CCAP 1560/4]|eukprot:KNH06204.1 aspartate aminotransferase [Perkinsela sp. CCAP 1560/4]
MSLNFIDKPIETIPLDPIFDLSQRYKEDQHPKKVDLGVGAYRSNDGKPYLLRVVKEVEKQLASEEIPKEYLSIDGMKDFTTAASRLLYGSGAPFDRIYTMQTLSGTGGIRMAAEFLCRFMGPATPVYSSDPTWPNHPNIFAQAGFSNAKNTYRYFDQEKNTVAFTELMEDLKKIPQKAILILQVCAHNPTGADMSAAQWNTVAEFLKQRKDIAVLMDCAYQGYASGDVNKDNLSVRIFLKHSLHFFSAQSFAKNMGLYGERVGCLSVVCKDSHAAQAVGSHLRAFARASYSNPPSHGARIVSRILNNESLKRKWMLELKEMSQRIKLMRLSLRSELEKLHTPGCWKHITQQIGMFSLLGLTGMQCDRLVKKHHIYITKKSRISVAGLNTSNVKYVAIAINEVVRHFSNYKAHI